ncbi:MAG: prepilin peptidase [Sphingomonadales bacterium]|nr:prepilin peptidase [Sphingomonadales bacterium]
MLGGLFTYGLLAALAIALLVAAVTDIRRRQIDNWLNAAIALGAPLFWVATGLTLADIGWQLGIALGSLAVFAGMFALGWMGGGDVKLLTAMALWIQPYWFAQLIVVMAIAGGALSLAFGVWHIAGRRREKPAIPYGIAISGAGLWALASQYIPAFQNGGLFG